MLPTTAAMFLVFLAVLQLTSRLAQAADQGCLDIPTDSNFKMEDVEGPWFPTDIVRHRDDIKINGVPLDSKCPVVSFSVPNRSKKVLMMVWNSTEGELEYRFTQKSNLRGQWQSAPDQQGGKFYILSLEKDKFMVLRFCSSTMHSSYILSRQSGGSQPFAAEARNTLDVLVKYPQIERQTLCNGGTGLSRTLPTATVFTSISMLILMLRK